MGFKDLFVGDNAGNYSAKVKCTGCNRVTVVKIPQGKTVEKWSRSTKCGQCNAFDSWISV